MDCYSTGCYGEKKADGLTLQFNVIDTELDYYTIFNVDCSQLRGSNKGKRRPDGQFSVRQKHAFYKFWHRTCGLPTPSKGLTTFHDCMGKLKSIVFMAEISKGTRLDAGTLRPMSLPDNALTTTRQLPDKNLLTVPDKDINQIPTESTQESISTTCPDNYVISKQVSEYTSNPISPIDDTKRVQNQTTDEWLAEYEEQWALECDELF